MKATVFSIMMIMSITFGFIHHIYAQDRGVYNPDTEQYEKKGPLPSDSIEDSLLSPESIKKFQNEDRQEFRDDRTIAGLYQGIDLFRLRSVETSAILSSGTIGDKNNFESMEGFSVGLTWEFPILVKSLGGGTPILKVKVGKTDIDVDNSEGTLDEESTFFESVGVSEVYTYGVGGGYCYHAGFNCFYGMYNSSLTGQLATFNEDGQLISVPTQLSGYTVGMSSTFEAGLGVELTAGLEYSLLEHVVPIFEKQQINSFNLVLGIGFQSESRYKNLKNVQYIR